MVSILYVEDNIDTAQAVTTILKKEGYDAETVSNGKKAIQMAKKHYDLFLLDVMLPDMSGWDIFEKLRVHHNHAHFAFLSAIPVSSERLQELKNAGVSDYITKPFTKSDLIIRIKKILGN